jgi:hypothetical protein
MWTAQREIFIPVFNMKTGFKAAYRKSSSSSKPTKCGRPPSNKVVGPLRNFNLVITADQFLLAEKARSGRTMVAIIESALLHLRAMKPNERDAAFISARRN